MDTLKFTVSVQVFSNINQVVKFHIDMKLNNNHKLRPDKILHLSTFQRQIILLMESRGIVLQCLINNRNVNYWMMLLLHRWIWILHNVHNMTKVLFYEFSNTKEEEYDTEDLSLKLNHSYCSEDSSKSDYLESEDDLEC